LAGALPRPIRENRAEMAATTQIIGMAEITVTVATRAPDVAQLLGLDISRNTAKAVDIAQWKEFNVIRATLHSSFILTLGIEDCEKYLQ
jgi:hypothetical protein